MNTPKNPEDYDDEDTEEAAEAWTRASMTAFAEDWDSEADAIYDDLFADAHDLSVVERRRSEPTVSWDEVKRRLGADGLLRD